MSINTPQFADDKERAVQGSDDTIYSSLGLHTQAPFTYHQGSREESCNAIEAHTVPLRSFDERPSGKLPFTRHDLREFINSGLSAYQGYWSVLWGALKGNTSNDYLYRNDDFRGVVIYNTIEFMIRPLGDLRLDKSGPPRRLYIGCLDVRKCLTLALENSQGRPDGEMTTVLGIGYANFPDLYKYHRKDNVPFEWRIDRAEETRIAQLVEKWRYHAFGSAKEYRKAVKAHEDRRRMESWVQNRASGQDPASSSSPQPQGLFRSYIPPGQPEQGSGQAQWGAGEQKGTSTWRKRSSGDPDPPRSHKRRSTGFSSGTTSPDMSRSAYLAYGAREDTRPPSTGSSLSRGMQNLNITAPAPAYYGEQGQGQAPPPPRGYGDDMLQSNMVDGGAGVGPVATYFANTGQPMTGSRQSNPRSGGGYYPPQVSTQAQGTYGQGYDDTQQLQQEPTGSSLFGSAYTAYLEAKPVKDMTEQELFDVSMLEAQKDEEAGLDRQFPSQGSQGGGAGQGGSGSPGPYNPSSSHGHHGHHGHHRHHRHHGHGGRSGRR